MSDAESDEFAVIQQLRDKYAGDPYMASRLKNFICNQLPNVLDTMALNHQQRVIRTEELTFEYGAFIKSFLNNNRYFYVSSTEKFFYYDGVHYKPYNEDGILHHILTTITNDRSLMSWKYKTKVSIMKRIKDHALVSSASESTTIQNVPESITIQNVIMSLYPAFFSTKSAAKYFLTVLGDNILKKRSALVHILPPYAKAFMRELTNYCQLNIGINPMYSFKLKYHEHEYTNCRLIHVNETVKYENTWKNLIEEFGIDIICVACHYSTRFDNSDDFVAQCQDSKLSSHTFYLNCRTVGDIVGGFKASHLTTDKTNATTISWKNMLYLWKHFLTANKLPMIIFQGPLKTELISMLRGHYDEQTDMFNGVFSKFIPEIQRFNQFWDETMSEDEGESNLELGEVRQLFNKWGGSHFSMSDTHMIDLIQYFYPNVLIENDKYIQEIRCSLWDKKACIKKALTEFRKTVTESDISVYDAYVFYCKYNKTKKTLQIVHKSYFEKYVSEQMGDFIAEPGIISKIWFSQN